MRNRWQNVADYPTSESVPVLSTEEEATARSALARFPDDPNARLIARLLATLDAERAASAARIAELEAVIDACNLHRGKASWKCPACQKRVARARAALTSEAHRG